MSITSMDIQQQSFEMARHGYDVQEVDVFLERMASEVDILVRQNTEYAALLEEAQTKLRTAQETTLTPAVDPFAEQKSQMTEELIKNAEDRAHAAEAKLESAQKRLADLERQLAESNSDASTISEAFIAAQRSANALKEEARAEGERLYHDAEAKCRELLGGAQDEKKNIEQDIQSLKDSRTRFAQDYTNMLKSFMADAQSVLSASEQRAKEPTVAKVVEAVAAAPMLDLGLDAVTEQKPAPAPASNQDAIPSYKSAYADVPTSVPAKSGEALDYGETDAFEIEEID
jgi:cell division initiation protein